LCLIRRDESRFQTNSASLMPFASRRERSRSRRRSSATSRWNRLTDFLELNYDPETGETLYGAWLEY
jgi:hypothetical protein